MRMIFLLSLRQSRESGHVVETLLQDMVYLLIGMAEFDAVSDQVTEFLSHIFYDSDWPRKPLPVYIVKNKIAFFQNLIFCWQTVALPTPPVPVGFCWWNSRFHCLFQIKTETDTQATFTSHPTAAAKSLIMSKKHQHLRSAIIPRTLFQLTISSMVALTAQPH
jgi:hypothetical protein